MLPMHSDVIFQLFVVVFATIDELSDSSSTNIDRSSAANSLRLFLIDRAFHSYCWKVDWLFLLY